ncbi:acyl-CoA thioesterase [Pseudomonas sp. 17391]|jgi:acyl-CoA thioester hydrolase|uniref:Acyl-CoA thioesterase n=1 Tax=Pseudomonas urmiensis TaxID=2745493 RepID=A0ABW8NQQ4_9PSED|nr:MULTISPECIES: acyl-CoA thioesterase [Pseudomonas]HDS1758401.1 acyl-CoA thioesterase [Pseudomonas putida]AVF54860.1 acyl-CoA thioesterase [Pseudomonas fulva]MBH3362883.1 acyl-CoA thioesterase [Pseudomonas sp. URMO17WK12:I11]MBM7396709.1 acyl-CoA thioester hydrolase [Pseudomonas sp. M5]MDD2130854.1 acyl-CoA thioesterase [Pseudomonas sp. 17391]
MEITYRGVVYPAQTDAMGHMTVQYYVAAFDQAFWHLIHSLGYNADWRFERKEGWADVRYEIDYRAELKVGDLFKVASMVKKVGNASIVTHHQMFSANDELCAEIQMTSVYFDLEQRTSKAIPNAIKEAAMSRIQLPSDL